MTKDLADAKRYLDRLYFLQDSHFLYYTWSSWIFFFFFFFVFSFVCGGGFFSPVSNLSGKINSKEILL
jgi:hypothetical protein